MKYVIFKGDTLVVFSKGMNHSDFSKNGIPISAGFCSLESYRNQFDDIKYRVSCWGRSDSLGLSSTDEDAEIIANGLNV